MNKIELIRKSIEDKTGLKIHVAQQLGTIYFSHMGEAISYGKIDESFLQYLPISDPIEEQPDKGWIPLKERLPNIKEHGKKVLLWREMNASQSEMAISIYDTDMVKYCDKSSKWQVIKLPSAPVKQG